MRANIFYQKLSDDKGISPSPPPPKKKKTIISSIAKKSSLGVNQALSFDKFLTLTRLLEVFSFLFTGKYSDIK